MKRHLFSCIALLCAVPLAIHAQTAPAGSGSGATMDMPDMAGMTSMPAKESDNGNEVSKPYQGTMSSMEMPDDDALGMLLVDQLEQTHSNNHNGQSWEAEGWYGYDLDKLWVRSGGDRDSGRLDQADVEALWNHAFAPFWGTQLGIRQDVDEGPSRTWAALGVQGLAPYNFEVEATAYVGNSGHLATRLRAEYDVRFTQRLILQPEAELNLYNTDAQAQRFGESLSSVQIGLRLRYEIRRQLAPYIGINWVRRLTTSADAMETYRQPRVDRQIVAGLHFWF